MQSPCKLVFTDVLLLALPHKHMYSHTCIQLDADWAVWLKPELIAGKSVHLCMCALSLLHTGISLRSTISYLFTFLESFLSINPES